MVIATAPEREVELRALVGSAASVIEGLARTRESARLLSCDQPRLIDDFESRWVGVFEGKIVGVADTLAELLAAVDATDPSVRPHLLARFIDRSQQRLIL